MKTKLLDILEEQLAFEFTGRINVLQKANNQFVGYLGLKEGKLFFCKYKNFYGIKALEFLVIEDELRHTFKLVVEPEIVDCLPINIFENSSTILSQLIQVVQSMSKIEKLKPPEHIKISISGEFIFQGSSITPDEFDVLCLLSDFSSVKDIYASSAIPEYKLTSILVFLKRKNALKLV